MDDVWKQISLTSLNHHHHRSNNNNINTTTTPSHGMFFQDFLPPLSSNNKDPPAAKYGSSVPRNEISVPTPGTMLSLSPCQDFEYPDSNDLVKQNPQICLTKPSYFSHDYDVMPSHSSADYNLFSKKRESDQNGDLNLCDRRHKRMMKNRESAARSRSRRQAYTTELQVEIKKLAQENAMLKKQHEKLFMTVASSDEKLKQEQQQQQQQQQQQGRVPKKHTLQRTSTCPF